MKRAAFVAAGAAVLLGAVLPASAAPSVGVSGTWSRPAVDQAVVYGVVRNDGAKPLVVVGGSSPIARNVELHESMTMQGGTMNGMAMTAEGMQAVPRYVIPPHGTLTLKPGGYHLMLLGLHAPLPAGHRFPVTLRFADGSHVTFTVPVENRAF
jgi:periplasmic copper chaperone A